MKKIIKHTRKYIDKLSSQDDDVKSLLEIVTISDDNKILKFEYYINLILTQMGIKEVIWISNDTCFSAFAFYDKECEKLSKHFNLEIKPNDNIADIAEKLANIN
jgi:hypothetical protein